MARKVYTYRSIEHIDKHPCYREFVHMPHITATSQLKRAMASRYPEMDPVIDIHALQKHIIKGWEERDIALQQLIHIGDIIKGMDELRAEGSLYMSFTKNKRGVLNAIRLLVEADIFPEQLSPTNEEEKFFIRIWEELEENDRSYYDFRTEMSKLHEDISRIKKKFKKVIPGFDKDSIVLHGFYFITPIQEQIFEMLESCGKTLIFLCCIDTDLPAIHQIWYETLATKFGFPDVEEWISDGSIVTENQNSVFGKAFEGIHDDDRIENIKLINYGSEMAFISDVGRLVDEGYQVFSTDLNVTENLLKEFYPDKFKRRHLLSYPVGQYIYKLHSMWNTHHQRLELKVEDIQTCFSSGWVIVNGINAKDRIIDLEKLCVYTSDCVTLEQWEERLALLQQISSNIFPLFENHLEEISPENRTEHRMMSNPLLNFSCFSFDEKRLDELIMLIKHLIKTARDLFENKGRIDIYKHFERLRKMIANEYDEDSLLAEEKVILDELCDRLSLSRKIDIDDCLPDELSEAIMLIIGEGILDEDSFQVQSSHDEEFIHPLYQVESIPLTENRKVHLCFADEVRLPGRRKPYMWPITDDMLDRIDVEGSKKRKKYLAYMRHVIDGAPLSKRYLFYSLIQNEKVEISWISTQDEKEIASSPYLQLLQKLFMIPVEKKDHQDPDMFKIDDMTSRERIGTLSTSFETINTQEGLLDLMLCPWRYIYGYTLQDMPSFQNGFQYNFAISKLIAVLKETSNIPLKDVGKYVFQLFPYLREVEKRQIYDFANIRPLKERDTLDHVSYPKERLLIHYLQEKLLKDAENKWEERLKNGSSYLNDFSEKIPDQICMYCPFSESCPHNGHLADVGEES